MKLFRQYKWMVMNIILLLVMIVLAGWSSFKSKYSLSYTSYSINTDKVNKSIKFLQITDLHNSIFGEKNQELIAMVAEQSPNLILITGDLLNSNESRTDIATDLISNLCKIAPVYISLGNHEVEYQERFGTDVVELYEAAGAVVLERQFEDILINGQQIRLGGIYGYCLSAKYLETDEADPEECDFLTDFQNTDLYTILLCHIPVSWMLNDGLDEWDVDCVISGHVHGGQIILPLIGGVYAPDIGWFPGKLQGLYSSEYGRKTMILSTGLGNTEFIPRLNNIPEVVTVDILPQ